MTALTMADAEADCHGWDRPTGPADVLGVARGDVLIPGERCAGPCHLPLARGERYVLVDGVIHCLACGALNPEGDPDDR